MAVGIGMLFNYQKYSEFDINIFDYSDVFDFLIAPFADFNILLFALSSSIVVFLLLRIDVFWKKKFPKSYSIVSFRLDRKNWFNSFRYIYLLPLDLSFTYIYQQTFMENSQRTK